MLHLPYMTKGMTKLEQSLQNYIAENAFILKEETPLYKPNGESASSMFDFRKIVLSPTFLSLYTQLFFEKTKHLNSFQVCGLEATSLPLLTAIVLHGEKNGRSIHAFFIRKSRKKDGALSAIEGVVGDTPIVLVDDILHSGASFQKQLAVLDTLRETVPQTPQVIGIVPVLTYKKKESYDFIQERGLELLPMFTLRDFYERFPILASPQNEDTTRIPDVRLAQKNLIWSFKPPQPNLFLITPKAPPVYSEGTVYLGADNGMLYALRADTGEEVFVYRVLKTSVTEKTFSRLIVTPTSVIFSASDKNLHAINKKTGKREWVFLEADMLSNDCAYDEQESLVFACGETGLFKKDTTLYAISLKNGKKVWEASKKKKKKPYLICSRQYKLLFVYDKDGVLYVLCGDSGELAWRYETHLVPSATPSLSEDERYLVLSGIDTLDKARVSVIDIKKKKEIVQYDNILYGITGQALVIGDVVIVGGLDRTLHAFSLTTGVTLWSIELRGRILASPLFIQNKHRKKYIYIGTTTGALYRIDKETGVILDQTIISERVTSAGAYDAESETYFLASSAQELYALRDKK